MSSRKRGDATKMIIERLEKGPAYPKQISDDLGLPESTVKHNLLKVLPSLGLVKQQPDGKYAVKWFDSKEHEVRNKYECLQRRLLRPPLPDEMASFIKEEPLQARNLLFKYIPEYLEPCEMNQAASRIDLLEMIIAGLDIPDKESLLNEGIITIETRGLDSDALEAYLNDPASFPSLDRAKAYLAEFPDMKPDIQCQKKGDQLIFTFIWSDYAKCILKDVSIDLGYFYIG
jgi:hypothetical protein